MLSIKNLSYEIKENGKSHEILKNISFNFRAGKNYVVTGANGCGKSTLAKIIMGMLTPTGGQILLDGKNITNLGITQRAKLGISISLQQPIKFKGLTAKNILEFANQNLQNTKDACFYLSKVGLCAKDYLSRELNSTLSGGELKRIEIATTLARCGKVNIFDEPEAGIDIWSFNGLVDIFKKSITNNSINIIISHQEKLFKCADELILIADGKIVCHGEPKKVLPLIKNFSTCKKLEVK